MTNSVIDTRTPLEPTYVPAQFIGRDDVQATLREAFAVEAAARLQHLHVYGPRGAGKTHLLRRFLTTFPPTFTTCYLSGIPHDTQYKALERLYQQLTGTELGTGHHVADVQRRIAEQVTLPTVIVLDDFEFILLKDGDDLLYFLTRLENTAVITVSATHPTLEEVLDERVYSSFRPQRVFLSAYTPAEARQILADRARRALKPASLQHAALTHIARTTRNITLELTWLRDAADTAESAITLDLVRDVHPTAVHDYVLHLLDAFTPHHRRLYEAIDRLAEAGDTPVRTGPVYAEYHAHCDTAGVAPLGERRIGDFLTQLTLLGIIETTMHYGGPKGKTREIRLADWHAQPASEEPG